jgi:hypothetical protein
MSKTTVIIKCDLDPAELAARIDDTVREMVTNAIQLVCSEDMLRDAIKEGVQKWLDENSWRIEWK